MIINSLLLSFGLLNSAANTEVPKSKNAVYEVAIDGSSKWVKDVDGVLITFADVAAETPSGVELGTYRKTKLHRPVRDGLRSQSFASFATWDRVSLAPGTYAIAEVNYIVDGEFVSGPCYSERAITFDIENKNTYLGQFRLAGPTDLAERHPDWLAVSQAAKRDSAYARLTPASLATVEFNDIGDACTQDSLRIKGSPEAIEAAPYHMVSRKNQPGLFERANFPIETPSYGRSLEGRTAALRPQKVSQTRLDVAH